MLRLLKESGAEIIRCDDYYIRELASGLDEAIFTISVWDPLYPELVEEARIQDRDQQVYLIKQIDGGEKTAKVIAQIDLDAWKDHLYIGYNNGIATVANTVAGILPSGWTMTDDSGVTIRRQVNGALTAYEICAQCEGTFGVWFRWNNATKTVRIVNKNMGEPSGAFATRDLNLKKINYKGKSNGLITRLYCFGKDDMTFASINDGKAYVDNFTYTDKVLPGFWKDERYTVKENLLEDGVARLAELAVPRRSYECAVVDLQAVDPERYGFLDFSLFTVATLIDDIKNFAVNYEVVERHIYPYYPEKNDVIFDTSPERITGLVDETINILSTKVDAASAQVEIDRATGTLQSGYSGYIMLHRNSQGFANEFLAMDTNDIETAQNILRINQAGIGFSSNGYGGPYYNSWTLDGFLSLGGTGNHYGTLEILNSSGQVIGKWDKDGIVVNAGLIQGPQIIAGGANNANGTILVKDQNGNTIGSWTKDGINATQGTFSGTITGSRILSSYFGTTSDNFYVVESGDDDTEVGISGFYFIDSLQRSNAIGSIENPASEDDSKAAISGTTGYAGFTKLWLLDPWFEGQDGMWDVTRTLKWLDSRLTTIEGECWQHTCSCEGDSCGSDSCDECACESFYEGPVESC